MTPNKQYSQSTGNKKPRQSVAPPIICIELQQLISQARAIVNDRILRLPQVKERTGRAGSTVWSDINKKVFPPPVALGPRAVGWKNSEISAWIDARAFASRTGRAVDMTTFVSLLIAPNNTGA